MGKVNAIIPPIAIGNIAARELYEARSADPHERLEVLGRQLQDHYVRIGMWGHDPGKAYRLVLRGMHRACLAPIAHGIELEIAEQLQAAQHSGGRLVTPERAGYDRFDKPLYSGRYACSGKQLTFLRVAGSFVDDAASRFIDEALCKESHWCHSLLHAFWDIDEKIAAANAGDDGHMRSYSKVPYERLKGILLLSNKTVLTTLIPAMRHAPSWAAAGESICDVLLRRADEVSWPQSTKRRFFGRYFPAQPADGDAPEQCPYEHDAARIAKGAMYRVASLRTGPWTPGGFCPSNIPFRSKEYPHYGRMSGATLRMLSAIPIACELALGCDERDE